MTKFKIAHGISNNGHRNSKNDATNNKKHQKFKKTPNGKTVLINGSQAQSNGNPKNQKNKVNFCLQTKSSTGGNKQSAGLRASTSGVKFPQVKIEPKEEKDDSVLSDEEVTIKEEDEKVDADSNVEVAVKNKRIKMLEGLKQEIKEEPSSSDAEDTVENRGIKMFESLKQKIKEEPSSSDAEDTVENIGTKMFKSLKQEVKEEPSRGDDDDDNEEEESEENEEDETAAPGLAALLGPSIADESDDEDFEATVKESDDDGDEDDEDEEDEEDDEDDEDLTPVVKNKKDYETGVVNKSDCESTELTEEEREERDKRTVFIGNVPIESDMLALQKKFRQFGIIESMRLRGDVPVNQNVPRKVAAILKKNARKTKTVCYLITYKNEDSVKKALSMNGMKLDGNKLMVTFSRHKKIFDKRRAVHLTNLPFTIEENELRKLFKPCGPIESLTILRNRKTGLGRGRGFVNFESVDGVMRALTLNGTKIKNQEISVKRDNIGAWRTKRWIEKTHNGNRKRSLSGTADRASSKKIKTANSQAVEIATPDSVNAEGRKVKKGKKKRSQGEKHRVKADSSLQGSGEGKYLGQKVDAKTKPKQNKSAKKKKQTAAKVLAKLKKSAAT